LEANIRLLNLGDLPFAGMLLIVAVLSKVLGCSLGALLGGLSRREALQVGVGMTSRGEVGLIVASVGMSAGLIDEGVFASVVLMVLATTMLTPIILRALYPSPTVEPEPQMTTRA
jgi:Kef-type K+ transport system membrane component KefB